MDYVLNINTNKYDNVNKLYDFNYTFLNNLKYHNIDIDIFYDILNSYELYKLKNIYNFIYKRLNKLHIDNIEYIKPNINISQIEFNNLLDNYIDSELKSIIIINSIQQYYYPMNI